MRHARSNEGLSIDGDAIIPYRSPDSVRVGGDAGLSFNDWNTNQPLPDFQDHITGYNLLKPNETVPDLAATIPPISIRPNDSRFGPPSAVNVPVLKDRNWEAQKQDQQVEIDPDLEWMRSSEISENEDRKRNGRPKKNIKPIESQVGTTKRKPVHQRWYYEPVANLVTMKVDDTVSDELVQPTSNPPMGSNLFVSKADITQDLLSPSQHGVPNELGTVLEISAEQLDMVTDDEIGACYLQARYFIS
jgi:hypothetical protein